jgi:hypothetical protein
MAMPRIDKIVLNFPVLRMREYVQKRTQFPHDSFPPAQYGNAIRRCGIIRKENEQRQSTFLSDYCAGNSLCMRCEKIWEKTAPTIGEAPPIYQENHQRKKAFFHKIKEKRPFMKIAR